MICCHNYRILPYLSTRRDAERKNHVMPTTIKIGIVSICSLFILIVFGSMNSIAQPAEIIELLKPITSETGFDNQSVEEPNEVYVNRTGRVVMAVEEIMGRNDNPANEHARIDNGFSEKQLNISFFNDQNVQIVVDSESRSKDNILSLGGHKNENVISTFSMTISDESYLITYHDLDNGLVYKVVGDIETGMGKVTEIDLKKLPPVFDSEPIVPSQ